MKLLSTKEVQERISCSRTTIWRMEREGKFPKHIRLGERRVAWVADEVDAWIAERVAQRDEEAVN